ncbi:MAG: hypothetical protein J5777_06500 [Clostridiales bacterium]|nr:hypothetical protein [Clostridiales bacterium]
MPDSTERPRVKHMPSYTKTAGRQALKSSIGKGIVRSGGRSAARVSARSARVLANILRSGSRMYSVTILRSLMRALMANVITAVITLGVFTLYDVFIWLRKERTGRQLLVNFISNIWVITWGTIAFFLWELAAKSLLGDTGLLAEIGGFITGFIVSILVCIVMGKVFDKAASRFYTSDSERMLEILGAEYERVKLENNLDHDQAQELLSEIEKVVTPKTVKQMIKSGDPEKYATDLIEPIIMVSVREAGNVGGE